MPRPKKAPEDVKSAWVKVRVSSEQMATYKRAAELAHAEDADVDFSTWVRRTLSREAEGTLKRRKGSR